MKHPLILPMACYVLYMWLLALLNLWTRIRAVRSKQIQIKYFKIYEGTSSERVTIVGRHYDNQFQLPILFFVTCALHIALGPTGDWTLIFAWGFVLSRWGHAYIHLGSNNITYRLLWFATGWFFIGALWLLFFI